MKVIRDIIQGSRNLPGFGPHPGTPVLLFMLGLTFLGGLDRGFYVALVMTGIVGLVFVPIWALGCIGRAREYQAKQ
jgi:hypothetical protein